MGLLFVMLGFRWLLSHGPSARRKCGHLYRGGVRADPAPFRGVRPARGHPPDHATGSDNDLGGHLDQTCPPSAGEAFRPRIAVPATIEERPPLWIGECLGRQVVQGVQPRMEWEGSVCQ